MPDNFTLETDRLLIRPLVTDDLEAVYRLNIQAFGDIPLATNQSWLDWTTRNYEQQARLHQPIYGERGVVLRATGELIGMVGIVPSYAPFERLPYFDGVTKQSAIPLNTCEMGLFWSLGLAHRGQGYATEAAQAVVNHIFVQWHLKRIVATTEYDNLASKAVMERLGMTIYRNPDPEPSWFQVVGILDNPTVE